VTRVTGGAEINVTGYLAVLVVHILLVVFVASQTTEYLKISLADVAVTAA
jgi:biopolymer transport protein ExbD